MNWNVNGLSHVRLGLAMFNISTEIQGKTEIFLTLSWPAGHVCPTYKEPFQVYWDTSIPLLHAAIYLDLSVLRETSQNALSRETAVYKCYLLHGAGSFLRSYVACSCSRNSPRFMEPEGSSPHSQAPATCPYPEPAQSSPHNLIPPPEGPS